MRVAVNRYMWVAAVLAAGGALLALPMPDGGERSLGLWRVQARVADTVAAGEEHAARASQVRRPSSWTTPSSSISDLPQVPPGVVPPSTGLAVTLVGTFVGKSAGMSSAIIADSTSRSAAYFVGDGMPGAGRIVAISPRWVDFERSRGGSIERLELAIAEAAKKPVGLAPAVEEEPGVKTDPFVAAMDAALKQTSETSFEVSRSFIDSVLANPMQVMNSARMRPGKDGIAVFGVKPNGAAARLGLKNGDKILAINGNALAGSSPDQLLALYTQLKSTQSLSVQVKRASGDVALSYIIK